MTHCSEMDIRREPSIQEVKDFEIHSSWVPITPVKPIQPKPQPIYAERQENQLGSENWFVPERFSTGFAQETQAQTNSVETNKGFNNWEASLTASHIFSDFSMDLDRLKNVPFANLMALADAGVTRQGNVNATSTHFNPIFNSQFEGLQLETSSANSPPAKPDLSFGSNQWNISSRAQNTPLHGYSIASQPAYDLNSPPAALTDAFSSRIISSQFAPITPDQSNKAENKQACDIHQSNVDERTNQVRGTQGNEVATTRAEVEELCHEKEQQQLTNDMSIAAISTQLQENHNPDIELNRTQQKPRRRKHRPKVVIEGQPKRTRKTAAPKSASPKENPPAKRKYVRKNGLNKTHGTPTVVASGSTDPKTVPCTEKSCRRKLDFDFKSQVSDESSSCRPQSNGNAESQAENFYTTVESKSTVQLGQGMESMVEKTQVGITYDLKHFQNKLLEHNMSAPERQSTSPPNPTKMDPLHEKLKAHAQIEQTRGKCQIVFSDETHDKQGSTIQMVINTKSQSATKTPNDSECCSSGCLTGEGERGIKRGHSCTIDEGETSYTNMIGVHYNYLHQYLATFPENLYNKILIPGMHFPAIHKKKRAENGQGSTSTLSTMTAANYGARQATHCLMNCAHAATHTSETNCRFSAAQFNTGSTSTRTASVTDAQGKQESFECNLPSDQTGRMTKKRSKGPTQGRSLASVIGIVEYKQLPTSPAGGAPMCGDMQLYGISNHPHTCMESRVTNTRATMKTKKHAKRNSCASSGINDATPRRIPTIDAVVDYLKWLDINLENNQIKYLEQDPYKLRYEEQKALVLYKRDGTVVPFEGSFGQVRKRRPRPKVDLDEETTKVWKLLLENINSEGVDGTDAEKAKWWEEERQVFRGRADSFIARMHLVQGDRRFSPWKGSVLDSVIGVFLTQNVSDHLSSSAFMSLAARFPLKSKSTDMPCFEDTSILVKEPEVFIEEPEDTIKWYEEKSNQPACNTITTTLHDVDCSIEKEVNSNELLGSSSGCVKPTDNMKCTSSDISGNGLELYHESTANIVIQHSDAVACLGRDKREIDDVLSSQDSAGSSQNFVDSSMAQTTERTGSFSIDNPEVDPATRPNANGLVGSSFLELLQRATLHGLYNKETANASAYKGNEHTYMNGLESDSQKHNKAGSDNPKTSFRPIISSSNYCSQMTPDSGVQGFESFEMLDEEKLSSDFSKKSEENCTSEQSGVTAESVSQTMTQIMNSSFQEDPRYRSENNHACSSFQGEANKILQSQNGPVRTPRYNIQSETGEQNHGMQQVLEVPNHSKQTLDIAESTGMVNNQKIAEHKAVEGKAINGTSIDTPTIKRGRIGKQKENVDWDNLRLQAQTKGKRERTINTLDSLDWEAVRCADVNLIADTIKERGMNNMLAERIKDFLNRLVREHESTDLEWLRDVPPDKAKEYLLSVRGLGLKSVECVRLLTLHHLAFPVDTNVGRIAVRLGWVPLQPLPESLQLHLLELYPVLESIQRYLWPRLCKLDQRTLYELHYQMITFGKVFCTKSKPNCNACPMRGECRHFASAFASARLALPGPEEKSIVAATENKAASQNPMEVIEPLQLPQPHANQQLLAQYQTNNCEPIIEEPRTPEPIVEVPATPGPELPKVTDSDIEDMFCEDPEEIPTIKLNIKELTQNLQNYMEQNMVLQEGDVSKALVALTSEAASIPMPKLKNVNQLRTEHRVYELPDSHPLLEGLDKREPDDPCSYLLAIWTPGETADSIQPPERQCSSQVSGTLCDEKTCFSCNSIREANSQTVRGTLLIPCRTAMRGSFPLNGTYFQVNEVFADHESSINPIAVPRDWIWNLRRRTVYFGTSIPTIFKGLSTESIQQCFWRGFVCVRGFDQKTRAPRPLLARLHFPASKLTRTKGKTDDQQV